MLVEKIEPEKIRRLTKKQVKAERIKRTLLAEKAEKLVFERTGNIEAAQRIGMSFLKGEYPKAQFLKFSPEEFSREDWRAIRIAIHKSDLMYFEKTRALTALTKLRQGIVPAESEMKSLGKVTGMSEEAVKMLSEKEEVVRDIASEVSSTFRTLLTSYDAGFLGRQGLLALPSHPISWSKAWWDEHRAFFSPEYTDMVQKEIATSKNAPLYELAGILTEIGGPRERMDVRFGAQWLKKVPVIGIGVRAAERAAVVGGNRLRTLLFDSGYEELESVYGVGAVPEAEIKKLGNAINHLTGRGTGKWLRKNAQILNVALLAPSYGWSKFQLIGDGASALFDIVTGKPSPVSKIIASELAVATFSIISLLTLLSRLGHEVEDDPRSSDYGKVKIGRTRIDVTAGYGALFRYLTQFVTGKGKALRSKELYDVNRLTVLGRFLQSKLAPVPGMVLEILGKSWYGA